MSYCTSSNEPPQEEVIHNITNKANNATTDTLLQMIETLSTKVDELKRPADKDINPRTSKKFKRYCWSCGCCPYWGKDCPNKNPGHQDNANFKNHMGEIACQLNNEDQETQEL